MVAETLMQGERNVQGKSKNLDMCRLEEAAEMTPAHKVPRVVDELVNSCGRQFCYDHVSPAPIPSQEAVVEIIQASRSLLFPGYFSEHPLDEVSLKFHLGEQASHLFRELAMQVSWAIRHDCWRFDQECSKCGDQGQQIAGAYMEALPGLRRKLGMDVLAAQAGDPAARSVDEIIFSYPGLFAITVYRLAHLLFEHRVPLLPRMMSEYAHGKTGIDIHPGAEIGESFFIDHGTGVVVGQTAQIGDRVRIYQGVTLGALSLAKEEIANLKSAKRHPTIEDDVVIYSGATILGGDTVIGARSIIGGNVWIIESVPPDTKVLLKTPELIYIGGRKREAV